MKRKTILFVTTILLIFDSFSQSNIPYGNNPNAGKFGNGVGIKLYYEIYGEGHPLVLLHGNGGSIASRKRLIEPLSKKYKVIAIDSRCHGKSDCLTKDLNYEMMTSDINNLLQELGIDSTYIWGHSDGGIIGLIMSYTYPSKVKKLITTGVNVLSDSTAIHPELIKLAKMYPMIKDTIMQKQIKLTVFHPNISWNQLKNITVPVLLFSGDRDAIRNEHTVKIFQTIPNSQLCILPGTTHFLADEQPSIFLSFLNNFFQTPFRKPSTIDIMQKYAEGLLGK